MTREDWHMVAEIVDDLLYEEPISAEERVWNMAVRHAGYAIRRAGYKSPWRADEPRERSEPERSDASGASEALKAPQEAPDER